MLFTQEMKDQAEEALREHMHQLVDGETQIGSLSADEAYLRSVQATMVGTELANDSDVWDVLQYFGIVER